MYGARVMNYTYIRINVYNVHCILYIYCTMYTVYSVHAYVSSNSNVINNISNE